MPGSNVPRSNLPVCTCLRNPTLLCFFQPVTTVVFKEQPVNDAAAVLLFYFYTHRYF